MGRVVSFIDEAPENLAPFDATAYLRGVLDVVQVDDGRAGGARWVRPMRFLPEQLRALESCAAWHPALFSQMARTTAGVCLECKTDARTVFLDVCVDAEPKGTTAQVELAAGGPTTDPYDGISVFVDGREVLCDMPRPGRTCLAIDVAAAREAARPGGVVALPGFEAPAHVQVWLPCLRGCTVGGVYVDSGTLSKVDARPVLLCLGDSITQGFLAGDPAHAWAMRVARAGGYDLLNQGVGGQVFQTTSLAGLSAVEPAAVWIALGTNYRFSACNALRERPEIARYFKTVHALWPDVKTYVATPLFSDKDAYPTHVRSCYGDIPALIAAEVAGYPLMELVDGTKLMDPIPKLYADADHPDGAGHAQIARRVARVLKGLPPKEPRVRPEEKVVEPEQPREEPRERPRKKAARKPKKAAAAPAFLDVCLPLDFSGGEGPAPGPVAGKKEPAVKTQEGAEKGVGPELGTDKDTERVVMTQASSYETHHDGSPLKKDEKAALAVLSKSSDLGARVMIDTILRGGAQVRYAGDACVCLDTTPTASMLWAEDVEEAELAAEDVAGRMVTTMCERVNGVVRAAQSHEGPADPADEWRLGVYLGSEPIAHKHDLTIDPLDGSWARKLRSLYAHPEFYTDEEMAEICDSGRMWGAFDERCDLVGFIGMHGDGAMGLLEVLPAYRRHGYASELEATLTNTLLARGWLPWGQIFCDNEASFALQEKLGVTVGDDRLLCSFPEADGKE